MDLLLCVERGGICLHAEILQKTFT
uniref:Uncharacterized protein n=1 Tax=Anguilla anguilla TaxID=7936 RepID=A0A0E9RA07_ANGAN